MLVHALCSALPHLAIHALAVDGLQRHCGSVVLLKFDKSRPGALAGGLVLDELDVSDRARRAEQVLQPKRLEMQDA